MKKKELTKTQKELLLKKFLSRAAKEARNSNDGVEIFPFASWGWDDHLDEEDQFMPCQGMESWLKKLFYEMKGIANECNKDRSSDFKNYFLIIAFALKGILEYSGRLQKAPHNDIAFSIEDLLKGAGMMEPGITRDFYLSLEGVNHEQKM